VRQGVRRKGEKKEGRENYENALRFFLFYFLISLDLKIFSYIFFKDTKLTLINYLFKFYTLIFK
jgi:hypothetical protein